MKIRNVIAGTVFLLMLLLLCTSCGCDKPKLSIQVEDRKSYYFLDEQVTLRVKYDGDNVTKKADVWISMDDTDTAYLKRSGKKYNLTMSASGIVTVAASYKDREVEESFRFVDKDEELDKFQITISADSDQYSFYQGEIVRLDVNGNSDIFQVDPSAVRYEINDNTVGATLTPSSDSVGRYLSAQQTGSVTVKAIYEMEGRTYTAQRSFKVLKATMTSQTARAAKVGDHVYLTFNIEPNVLNEGAAAYVTCQITSGSARMVQEDGGRYYIVASEPGAVEYVLNYSKGDIQLSTTATIQFEERSFTISSNSHPVYVGSAVSFAVSSDDIENIDASKLQYEVLEGYATFNENNELVVNETGTVKVQATYIYNGTQIKSNILTLTASLHSFRISTEKTSVYVGYTVPLSAASDNIDGFDPSDGRVQYEVLEGVATLNGTNELVVNEAGTVKVQATYVHNGVQIKSNILTLTASYDGNSIVKPEQLLKLNDSSDTFNLIADLDLSEYVNWEPIKNFTGTLRGHGHSITGLSIQAANLESEKGLFATMGGTVENLTLEGTITANGEVEYVGLLCGKNTGTITNVTVSGSITAKYSTYVGGIAGWSNQASFTGCANNATVQGRYRVGGLFGEVNAGEGTPKSNKNAGLVTGEEYVGGLCGVLTGKLLLSGNTNDGEIIATGNNAGGLLGYGKGGITITSCTNTAAVSGKDHVGGMIGYGEENVSEISFCENTGAVTGNLYVGGYAGYSHATTMKSLTNNQIITGKAWVGGIAGYSGKLDDCTNDGILTITGVQVESDNSKVSYVGGIAGFATSAVGCTNNQRIDASMGGSYVGGIVGYLAATRLSDAEFKNNTNNDEVIGVNSVGGIFGAFCVQGNRDNNDVIQIDGNVNNAIITGSENYIGGIIGYGRGESHDGDTSVVKMTSCINVADISGVDYIGGILGGDGGNISEISFCENSGDITGNLYVGGYAGRANGAKMRNLNNSNMITGKAWVGGIAGYAGELDTCENSGQLMINGYYMDSNNTALSYVGGIAGYATSSHGCENNADISVSDAGNYVGGLVGHMSATRSDNTALFSDNKNHGTITSNGNYVGGLFGKFTLQSSGNNETITIKGNSNDGTVVGADYVGGIVGCAQGEHHSYGSSYNYREYTSYVKIVECVNDASITGQDSVGGILGHGPEYMSDMILCSNTGDVTGRLYVGGYAGRSNGTAMRNLNNSNTITGTAWVGGIAGYAGEMDACENSGQLVITGHYVDDNHNAWSYVGGIAGDAASAHGCVNNADISVSDAGNYVGGLVGHMSATRSNNTTLFGDNKNHGVITSNGSYVGGLFGRFELQSSGNNETITIKGNSNDGTVVGADYVGGIAGCVQGEYHDYGSSYNYREYTSYVKVTDCTNDADVTGNDYVGGIIGNGVRYMVTDEVTWNTNTFTGSLTATGEHQGDLYGHIA